MKKTLLLSTILAAGLCFGGGFSGAAAASVATKAENGIEKAGTAVVTAGKATEKAAKKSAKGTKKAGKEIEKGTKQIGKETEKEVAKGSKTVGKGTVKGIEKITGNDKKPAQQQNL